MKMVICSVHDSKAGVFLTPFFARSRLEAIRSFGDAVSEPKSPLANHPDDYVLYCVGTWDDNDPSASSFVPAERLVTGLECVRDKSLDG